MFTSKTLASLQASEGKSFGSVSEDQYLRVLEEQVLSMLLNDAVEEGCPDWIHTPEEAHPLPQQENDSNPKEQRRPSTKTMTLTAMAAIRDTGVD